MDAARTRTTLSAGKWVGGLDSPGIARNRELLPSPKPSAEHISKETAQQRLLRCQLLVIGQVQPAASAADASVPADHGSIDGWCRATPTVRSALRGEPKSSRLHLARCTAIYASPSPPPSSSPLWRVGVVAARRRTLIGDSCRGIRKTGNHTGITSGVDGGQRLDFRVLLVQFRHGDHAVVVFDVDQPDALRRAADGADRRSPACAGSCPAA